MSAADDIRPADPLSEAAADALLAPLGSFRAIVLAVSGGADSTALMHLAARWVLRSPSAPKLHVASVDHGLRPEAATEAEQVVAQAKALGLGARTLRWEGQKPAAGIQDAARRARYALLLELAIEVARDVLGDLPSTAIVTAHTADDQAETVLMRLARGSGVDGLAAMPVVTRVERMSLADGGMEGVALLRPLLAVPRARLVATLPKLPPSAAIE